MPGVAFGYICCKNGSYRFLVFRFKDLFSGLERVVITLSFLFVYNLATFSTISILALSPWLL